MAMRPRRVLSLLSPSSRLLSAARTPQNMFGCLQLLLGCGGASASSPSRQCEPRSFSSLPGSKIASFSKPRGGASQELFFPDLYSWVSGSFRASRMSSGGSESSSAPSVAHKPNVRYCQSCGGPTKQVIPDGEEKMRAVCTLCGRVHYENPKMVVGCLVEHNGKVLLCKRKIQPSYGFWTLPAGFMEIGETAVEGATRETLEEACAEVEILSPFAQLDIPCIGHIYIIFRAKLKKPHFSPGPESLECALFSPYDIPFDSLAFSSMMVTLRLYIEDLKAGNLKFHYCTIIGRPGATSLTDPHGFDVSCLLHS